MTSPLFSLVLQSYTVPGSPSNLTITTVNPRTIHMSWDPPPFNQRNGIILRYSINITTLTDQCEVYSSLSTSNSYTVNSLRPYTSYSCSVAAETSVGRGTYITQNTRLPEDGEGFNFSLGEEHVKVVVLHTLLVLFTALHEELDLGYSALGGQAFS